MIDANLRRIGYSNRAQFIRDAIVEKLALKGILVPDQIALAPARTGDDRPEDALSVPANPHLNDASSTKMGEKATAIGKGLKYKIPRPGKLSV